jgi:hypothetical protein
MERGGPPAGLNAMTRTTIFWIAAAAVSLATLGAAAQDIQVPASAAPPGPAAGDGSSASLKQLDSNGDGKLTKAEASADGELARRFRELDTDNSGKLDGGEFARFEVDGDTAQPDKPR